jgi:hypothetical protein
MPESCNRRQLLRSVVVGLLGAGSAAGTPAEQLPPAPAVSPALTRCPHYIDGTSWRHSGDWSAYPSVDIQGCPYCRNLARSGSEYVTITTYDLSSKKRGRVPRSANTTVTYVLSGTRPDHQAV